MLRALLADLAAVPGHRIVATLDPRARLRVPPRVQIAFLRPGHPRTLRDCIRAADAVWLIAPETAGCLARLAREVEGAGRVLLGSSSAAIRRASDKAALARSLSEAGIPVPPTRVLRTDRDPRRLAEALGYPVVVKPARGAGCEGVGLARDASELSRAIAAARGAAGGGRILMQRWVAGTPASVALVTDGRRAEAIAVNAQWVRPGLPFRYAGGETPLDHPLAPRAVDRALAACRAIPGLRGYVGVDLVLTECEATVIEVNPRLTTAYLGVRAALDANPAALALDACFGVLRAAPTPRRRVRFTAVGALECVGTVP